MSTGGSQATPSSQTVTQSNIPEEFMPYFERLMGRVEGQSLEPYQAYEGSRVAESGNFADIGAARDLTRNIAGSNIEGLDEAQAATRANISRATELGQYGPGQFSEFGFDPTRQFTGAEVENYMSPYMTNVMDFQKSRAVEDFDRGRGARNARAIQSGAFGGSRQAVQEGIAEEALSSQLQGIDATGRQAAYEQASRQFGSDRDAQFATQQAQADELGRVQTGTEASRQFGASQGLAALQAGGTEAGRLLAMGEAGRGAEIQNAQLLDAIGRDQQGEAQAGLDIDYQDFLRQQGYPHEQLAFYSDILRGLPVANAGTTTETGSVYTNPAQQAVGAGLSGLALYRAYQ